MSNIVQVPASPANYTVGRLGYRVVGIIIHTMVGTLTATDATFANPGRQASAHYGIPYNGYNDAPIHQYVAEGNIAWHCGRYFPDASNPFGNTNTIGIEHADNGAYNNPRPDALYDASSQLVKEICARYGIPIDRAHIRKHSEVSQSPTACPDSLDINRIVAMAAGLYGGTPGTITSGDEDMVYVGPIHAISTTLKVFSAGSSYRERSPSSPPANAMAAGVSVTVSGYCYSTSPVQSSDLGNGQPGPDYLYWQTGIGWVPDAILDTTALAGAPTAGIPAGESMNLLFALAGSAGGAGTPGKDGAPGKDGTNGKDGAVGPVDTTHRHATSGGTGPPI